MKTLVITGGIATGKSTAVHMLTEAGQGKLRLFDCDAQVSRLLNDGTLSHKLTAAFGPRSVTPEGKADRDFLRELIFHDKAGKKRLEDIIHPLLHQECLAQRLEAVQNADVVGFVIDVPLFYEGAHDYGQDGVCVVATSALTQRKRLALRNGFPDEMIKAILAAQLPIMDKVARADFAIWNEGPADLLYRQVNRFYHHFFHA